MRSICIGEELFKLLYAFVFAFAFGCKHGYHLSYSCSYGICLDLAARSKRYRIATKGKVISCLPLSVLLC